MKKLICTLLVILASCAVFSQVPEGFNYQAIVRDSGGQEIANQAVGIQISILRYATDGSSAYVERFTPTTNEFGLVNLVIGTGDIQSGTFSTIDWSDGPYFLKVEMDESGLTSYVDMGTTQLLSVPYAFHSKTAANTFSGNYSDLTGAPLTVSTFTNDAGYLQSFTEDDPIYKSRFTGMVPTVGQMLRFNGTLEKYVPWTPNFLTAETDPKVGVNTENYLSKWDGSALVKSIIFDNDSIGIGTTTPEELLDVNGHAIIRGRLNPDWIDVNLYNTGDRHAGINFFGDDIWTNYSMRLMRYPGENGISILAHRGTGALKFYLPDAGEIDFTTNQGIRMKILSNGNVGIGTETPGEKLTVNGNLLVHGNIDFDGTIEGDIAIDSIHVSKITGLLGQDYTMSFPDILNNYVLLEVGNMNLIDNVIMIGSLGHETERISIPNGVDGDGNPRYFEKAGLTMEYPIIFETTNTDDANTLISWFDQAIPDAFSGSVIIKDLAGIETDRWNFYEYVPGGYEEGNDGRTRFTLVHRYQPDNLLRCVYLDDFGDQGSYNPTTDKLVDIHLIPYFTPAVVVDYRKRTITLTMDYVEGEGIKDWLEDTVLGIGGAIAMSIIETTDGTISTEISRRNYFECIPLKYEHFYGFGQNIKLKAKVVIGYGSWQEGQ